jgi:hypothetical protein
MSRNTENRSLRASCHAACAGEHFHVGLIPIADPYRRLALPQVLWPAALIHDPVHTHETEHATLNAAHKGS